MEHLVGRQKNMSLIVGFYLEKMEGVQPLPSCPRFITYHLV